MTSIKVGVKFRPILSNEIEANKKLQWDVSGNIIESTNKKHKFMFDNVFSESASTLQMYDVLAKPIIEKTIEGYNATIFAYGQTSSGKTFSMIGNEKSPGIIPLAIRDVLKEINGAWDNFSLRVGYIEIYNDRVYDLFDQNVELRVFESNGATVTNQRFHEVQTEEEILTHFHVGNKNRRIGETTANERSSRSHTIFQVSIESSAENLRKFSNLYLVDLAGSEKPDVSSSTFNEGLHINKSLLALGKIIRGLSKNSNLVNANFRECKLTRILSPALGGNSLTAVICTVSPTALDETFHTICFAQNAQKVKLNPTVNIAESDPQLLKTLKIENARLRREIERLKAIKSAEGSFSSSPMRKPFLRQPSSPTFRVPQSPSLRVPQSPATKIPQSPASRIPQSPAFKIPPSPVARKVPGIQGSSSLLSPLPTKRRQELIDHESTPAKRLRFEEENENLVGQEVVRSLMNQMIDAELENEEKLENFREEHQKIVDHKNKVIKSLEEGLRNTRSREAKVKEDLEKTLKEKNEILEKLQNDLDDVQRHVRQLIQEVELKNHEIDIMTVDLEDLKRKSDTTIVNPETTLNKSVEKDLMISALETLVQAAQDEAISIKAEYEKKLKQKCSELAKLKSIFKQRKQASKSQLVTKISNLKMKFLQNLESSPKVSPKNTEDFDIMQDAVLNFFQKKTLFEGEMKLLRESHEHFTLNCVYCDEIISLKTSEIATNLKPLENHFKSHHSLFMSN